ncbi:MAG: cadherin repeat domain-containing protein [Verrucomicrobiaceae bacterium]|nr:MAG: cadherin repeat domain-containing protein [Verrucomicrobiaceae bacterium]
MYIDLLEIEFAGNSAPQVEPETFQVSSEAAPGTLVGMVEAHDPDPGQSLIFSIVRGNEAGLFAISGDGMLSIAGDISASGGKHELTVVAIDNGLPELGGHSVVTVNIVSPISDLVVATGETRLIDSSGSRYSSISNDGVLIVSSDLLIDGNLSNRGILVISGGSSVAVNGTFSNSGVVDAINWTGEWQEEWVNNGKVLDRHSVRILSAEVYEGQFAVTVPGYNGHAFLLETSSSPSGPWQATGSSVLGSGDLLDPPAVRLSAPAQEIRRFFRVAITSNR